MSETNASPKRRYDATRRRERAAQTREQVVLAAGRVFVAQGYANTTIAAIAAEAGVAVETVYRAAKGKAGLLHDAVQAALAGGVQRAALPREQRPGIRAAIEEPDPRRAIELWADTLPGVYARSGPLLAVLATAAATDPQLTELQQRLDEQRLVGMRRFAENLAVRGVLSARLTVDSAADILWTLNTHATYTTLVTERGWTPAAFRDFMADAVVRLLLATP